MLSKYGGYATGEILFDGMDLLSLSEKQWRPLHGERLAMVPQSSMSALNPVFTIKRTFIETLKAHGKYGKESLSQIENLLALVGLESSVLQCYPHELSGGMRQRVSIALALLLDPQVLVLDEATTGLDVIVEADILKLLRELQRQRGFGMIFVSHDRRITGEFCHRRIDL